MNALQKFIAKLFKIPTAQNILQKEGMPKIYIDHDGVDMAGCLGLSLKRADEIIEQSQKLVKSKQDFPLLYQKIYKSSNNLQEFTFRIHCFFKCREAESVINIFK